MMYIFRFEAQDVKNKMRHAVMLLVDSRAVTEKGKSRNSNSFVTSYTCVSLGMIDCNAIAGNKTSYVYVQFSSVLRLVSRPITRDS